ncbi:hypothetical protein [Chromobacterium sp. CV08]|uniref:hypothetical protein n=1 Tax=Chromobacterium sp. CV08 TaxID=3133274 RepID=UPI003DA96DBD
MDESWWQFEAWLAQHRPEGAESLNPPASDERIVKLERNLGVKLPADFVAGLLYGRYTYSAEYGGLVDVA